MARKRLRAALFIVLLVGSAFSGGVGTVAASHDCDFYDHYFYVASWGTVNSDSCGTDHVHELQQQETEQEKIDLYTSGEAQYEASDSFLISISNYLYDSETVVSLDAKAAIADELEEGDSADNAHLAADQAIADYYSQRQVNILEHYEARAAQIHYNSRKAQNDSNITDDFYRLNTEDLNNEYSVTGDGSNVSELVEVNYTLINGSNYSVKMMRVDVGIEEGGSAYDPQYELMGPDSGSTAYDAEGSGPNNMHYYASNITVMPPTSSYNRTTVYDDERFDARMSDIRNKSNLMQANYDLAYAEAVYSNVSASDLGNDSFLSAENYVRNYLGSNSSDDYYAYKVASLATMGIATPDLNETGTMEIAVNESGTWNTYEGMLLSRTVPNGSLEVGVTYDARNLNGTQAVVTTGGNQFRVQREFRIENATTIDGQSMSSVGYKDYNYQTYDASEFVNESEQLLNLTTDLEAQEPTGSGDGSGSNSGGVGGTTAIALVALAAIALFAMNDGGGQSN